MTTRHTLVQTQELTLELAHPDDDTLLSAPDGALAIQLAAARAGPVAATSADPTPHPEQLPGEAGVR